LKPLTAVVASGGTRDGVRARQPTGPFRESEFAITPDGQAVTGDTCVKRRLLGSVPTATDVYSNTYRPASEFSTFFNNL
jgi:hypothetical protein